MEYNFFNKLKSGDFSLREDLRETKRDLSNIVKNHKLGAVSILSPAVAGLVSLSAVIYISSISNLEIMDFNLNSHSQWLESTLDRDLQQLKSRLNKISNQEIDNSETDDRETDNYSVKHIEYAKKIGRSPRELRVLQEQHGKLGDLQRVANKKGDIIRYKELEKEKEGLVYFAIGTGYLKGNIVSKVNEALSNF